MHRKWFPLLLTLALISCKNVDKVVEKSIQNKKKFATSQLENIIKEHYDTHKKFQTLAGKMDIDYDFGSTSGSHAVGFRMRHDSIIWLSATFDLVKFRLTPHSVDFYNKLNNTYFEGSYDDLSNFTGVNLDFNIVQNILTGHPAYSTDNMTGIEANDEAYLIQITTPENVKGRATIGVSNFRLDKQVYLSPIDNFTIGISYEYGEVPFPKDVKVQILKETVSQSQLKLTYKNLSFNKKMIFPYKVPEGYTRVYLSK